MATTAGDVEELSHTLNPFVLLCNKLEAEYWVGQQPHLHCETTEAGRGGGWASIEI